MRERTEWIDLLKGFTILLVVFGHNIMASQNSNSIFLTKYIYSFHIPLFFMISGILFNKHGTFREYIIKKSKNLLIPYLSFASILYLFWLLVGRKIGGGIHTTISPIQGFVGIFYGQPYYMPWGAPTWFLLCLFFVSCAFYVISSYTTRKITIIIFLTSVIGILTSSYLKIRLPWMIDTSFTALTLYGIAYLLKDVILNTDGRFNLLNKNIVLIMLFFIGLVSSIINTRVELAGNIYGNYILFYLSSVSSCLFYILLIKKISSYKKIYHLKNYFMYFGINSLIVLAFHGRAGTVLSAIYIFVLKIDYMTISLPHKILFSLIQLTLVAPVIYIFNKYLFVLLGKSSSKQNYMKISNDSNIT